MVGTFEEWKVRLSQSAVRLASGGWAWQKQPEAELSQDQVYLEFGYLVWGNTKIIGSQTSLASTSQTSLG